MGLKDQKTAKKPVTDKETITSLLNVPGRDGLLFYCFLYLGGRSSEIQKLKFSDFLTSDYHPQLKEEVIIKSSKQSALRKKLTTRTIAIHPELGQRVKSYFEESGCPPLSEYIFKSRRGFARKGHMGWGGVDLIIKKWFKKLELGVENPSSHTLRKTMSRQYYERMKSQKDRSDALIMTMQMLNHTSPATTLRYIGIESEVLNSPMLKAFYSPGKSGFKQLVKTGKISLKESLKKAKQLHPFGPPVEWETSIKAEFGEYDRQEVEEVLEITMPLLIQTA